MTTVNSISPVTDQLRIYDEAMLNWFKELPIPVDGKNIPVILATPDRAFASMSEILSGREGPEVSSTRENIPLPFVSIARFDIRFDPKRFHGHNTYWKLVASSRDRLTTYQVRYPKPYDLLYRVEFWAKNRSTLNALQQWTMTCFQSSEAFIVADLTPVWPGWTRKYIPFENGGIIDNSDLEPGSDNERIIRFTLEGTLKAWLMSDLEAVKAITKITVDTHTAPQATDLNTVTATEVDTNPNTYPEVSRVSVSTS